MEGTGIVVVAAAVTTALCVAGCSAGGGGQDLGDKPQTKTSEVVTVDKDGAESQGPAKAANEAKKGGAINLLWRDDLAHLDPAQVSTATDGTVSEVLNRRLTFYKNIDGKKTLVGDLATNAGETTDGGKTWKFTLKDGVRYVDGRPIKSQDVKYAVARTFSKKYAKGFPYIQSWLAGKQDYWTVYPGPYEGGELSKDMVDTPDDKSIIFKFAEPQPDLPFAAALGTTSPVPQDKDTQDDMDQAPYTSGPYKIGGHEIGKSLRLVKNNQWNPSTDAVRHQYVDEFRFEFGVQGPQVTERLINVIGDDRNSAAYCGTVASQYLQQVMGDPKLKERVVDEVTASAEVYSINTTRVADINVRKAIVAAFPKQQVRQAGGGSYTGDLSTTIGSKTNIGWQTYDLPGLTDIPATGDPEKAKRILTDAGKLGYQLSLAHNQTPRSEQEALAVVGGLQKAGFKVDKVPVRSQVYYDTINKVNNPYDLYWSSWAVDWPTASTLYSPVYDGRLIDDGRKNYTHFNDPGVNTEIDRIRKITDVEQQGAEWSSLDKKIMEQFPVVPYMYTRKQVMFGPNIGGSRMDNHFCIDLSAIYLRS